MSVTRESPTHQQDAWLVKTSSSRERRDPSPRGPSLLAPLPPPAELLDQRATQLLETGAWVRAFDPVSGNAFFYDAAVPLRRTWNLRAWVECQIVAAEVAAEQRSPARGQPLESSADDWRSKIVALYSQHNPAKLVVVDELLARYEGREAELWRNLMSKYGGPWSPNADAMPTPVRSSPPYKDAAVALQPSEEATADAAVSPAAVEPPTFVAVRRQPREPPSQPRAVTTERKLTPKELAELKARTLLDGAKRSTPTATARATSPRAASPRVASPRTGSPRVSKSPAATARKQSPSMLSRTRSPPTSFVGSATTGGGESEGEWATELQRRTADVSARRDALAQQRREAREKREADVAARAEALRLRREAEAAAKSQQQTPPRSVTPSKRAVRDRVSLIERQAIAADSLKARTLPENNRGAAKGGDFDASSPAQSHGWKVSRQIEYSSTRPKSPSTRPH